MEILQQVQHEEKRIYSPKRVFTEVKERVSILEYAETLTGLRRYGEGSWLGRCPLPSHEDKTPSFVVYEDGQAHCYGCLFHGDVVDLYQAVEGLEKPSHAAGELAVAHGIELGDRTDGWRRWQSEKGQILDAAEEVRKQSFRRRSFRLLVLPYLDGAGADEIKAAWGDYEAGLREYGR
jgi:DNA primase